MFIGIWIVNVLLTCLLIKWQKIVKEKTTQCVVFSVIWNAHELDLDSLSTAWNNKFLFVGLEENSLHSNVWRTRSLTEFTRPQLATQITTSNSRGRVKCVTTNNVTRAEAGDTQSDSASWWSRRRLLQWLTALEAEPARKGTFISSSSQWVIEDWYVDQLN